MWNSDPNEITVATKALALKFQLLSIKSTSCVRNRRAAVVGGHAAAVDYGHLRTVLFFRNV